MNYTELYDEEKFNQELHELSEALKPFHEVPYDDPRCKGRGLAIRDMKRYIANGIEDHGFEVSDTPRKMLDSLKKWGIIE